MTNLAYLSDGWLELESDPGLFTLLIEDFGCKNVQVEEIYDLSKVGLIDGHVYGFIFLFKWTEERRSRNRSQMFCGNSLNSQQESYYVEDENLVNSIFFAHQTIPNSCATHALLSVLLNCNHIDLGDNLTRLKEMTNCMDPESKGHAIGNMPELAKAHNQHASEIDTQEKRNKQSQQINKTNGFRQANGDSFHFISFVSINNRVYELDGLKKYPIDHGPICGQETFSEKFRKIILERIPQQQQKENKMNAQLRKLQTDMNTNINEDIRYSLLAVVPDRRKENLKRLKLLKSKKSILLEILDNLSQPAKLPEPYETHSYSKYSSTLSKTKPLEVNVNKLTVKDVNYNYNNNEQKSIINGNQLSTATATITTAATTSDQQFLDYDDSTDTCSECESKLSDDDSDFDEDGDSSKIKSLYAIKFVPLREQNPHQQNNDDNIKINNNNNNNNNSNNETKKLIDKNNLASSDSSQTNLKVFTKSELIDYYRDYGFNDLMNIINKIEQEINQCDHNIAEEIEKRTKFYIDDCRRTHNYNDFITTYLLMITEQKKLADFIEAKDTTMTTTVNNDQQTNNDTNPIKFFKEILTNYEDVLMNDDSFNSIDHHHHNVSIQNESINNNQSNTSINSNNTTQLINNSPIGHMITINDSTDADQSNKRKYSGRRNSKVNCAKRKEKIK